MKRIAVVTVTRSDYGIVRPLLKALDAEPKYPRLIRKAFHDLPLSAP